MSPPSSTWRILSAANEREDSTGVPISHLIGPVLVGVLLNCFVYGIVFLHWIQYTLGRNKDGRRLRALVHWCFLVDTVHSMTALWLLWHYSVNNFTKVSFLATTLWPVSAAPLFVALVSGPIQHLFAWRIKQFTHSWPIFSVLSFLSLSSFVIGIVSAAGGLLRHTVTASHRLIPLIDAWLGISMICDIMLAVLLFMHLWKSKTGFRSTDTVIGRLMRSSIETTVLSAIFCILYLTTFSVLPRTNFHVIFSLPLGRIYTGTLLSTLNSRSTLREELFGVSVTGDGFSEAFHITERMRRMPTEVAINVEQEVQREQCDTEEIDFKQLRKTGAGHKGKKGGSAELEFSAL
ncbi:hypothetical protein C8Q74DRAFT_332216 [Fomes fomentarius]|nr:hypothetical protein C8Q74DRAFT_332216 [Fomes fomentarius]